MKRRGLSRAATLSNSYGFTRRRAGPAHRIRAGHFFCKVFDSVAFLPQSAALSGLVLDLHEGTVPHLPANLLCYNFLHP